MSTHDSFPPVLCGGSSHIRRLFLDRSTTAYFYIVTASSLIAITSLPRSSVSMIPLRRATQSSNELADKTGHRLSQDGAIGISTAFDVPWQLLCKHPKCLYGSMLSSLAGPASRMPLIEIWAQWLGDGSLQPRRGHLTTEHGCASFEDYKARSGRHLA